MHVRTMNEIAVTELDKYIIIDTHGGQEDIFGIVGALQLARKYDKIVLGITCVAGRRTVEEAVHNALIAQQIVDTNIPVYQGAKQSLLLKKDYPKCYNFQDHSKQLNSLTVSEGRKALVQKQFAPIFIAQQIRKHNQELCVITFGPLTNLAIAFHQTQSIKVLSSVRINGGTHSGLGNVISSSGSQGNFYFDAQSAHIVISNYTNVYINPIDKTLQISWKDYFKYLRQKYNSNTLLHDILTLMINKQYTVCGPLITMVPAFSKQTVTKVLNVYSQIMTKGSQIVGMMAPNWLRLEVKEHEQVPNTKIFSNIDLQEIKKLIDQALDRK